MRHAQSGEDSLDDIVQLSVLIDDCVRVDKSLAFMSAG
jgi:hypothetical protein